VLQQAQTARDSVSGVNLDEEAANLIKYQQAYQAAAQVMTTVAKLFDTLLSISR
jgi:flagellar hook-associated protein 1 FlgK